MSDTRKRIAIDMDDVMADATGRLKELAEERLGIVVTESMLQGRYDWASLFPEKAQEIKSWVHEQGFFRKMKPKEGAIESVQKLLENNEVFVVSAAIEFPNSLVEKLDWLAEFFPFIDWKFVVFCGHKYMIKADFLIDDHVKNLSAFVEGQAILFDAPHNHDVTGYPRMMNWQDVDAFFAIK
jgi:5'(3')-deoxyribonucleotidase